jgi:hypothetical protein
LDANFSAASASSLIWAASSAILYIGHHCGIADNVEDRDSIRHSFATQPQKATPTQQASESGTNRTPENEAFEAPLKKFLRRSARFTVFRPEFSAATDGASFRPARMLRIVGRCLQHSYRIPSSACFVLCQDRKVEKQRRHHRSRDVAIVQRRGNSLEPPCEASAVERPLERRVENALQLIRRAWFKTLCGPDQQSNWSERGAIRIATRASFMIGRNKPVFLHTVATRALH